MTEKCSPKDCAKCKCSGCGSVKVLEKLQKKFDPDEVAEYLGWNKWNFKSTSGLYSRKEFPRMIVQVDSSEVIVMAAVSKEEQGPFVVLRGVKEMILEKIVFKNPKDNSENIVKRVYLFEAFLKDEKHLTLILENEKHTWFSAIPLLLATEKDKIEK